MTAGIFLSHSAPRIILSDCSWMTAHPETIHPVDPIKIQISDQTGFQNRPSARLRVRQRLSS